MDTSAASKRPLSYLADELEKPSTSHGTLDKSGSGAGNSCLPTRPLTEKEKADEARNKKCIQELLPWILEIENDTHEYLGNLTDPKNNPILDSMNYLIRKLSLDYNKYCKYAKLSHTLARYLREFLFTYNFAYNVVKLKVFFDKMTKILAFYTDMELCASVQKETDYETTNRIECVYRANLEHSEDYTVLDIFLNMKRFGYLHRSALIILLNTFLVKRDVKEPVELDDDLFVKYLIIFKKWFALEDVQNRQDIKRAFVTQAKPKRVFRYSKYASLLPADEGGSNINDNYVRFLEIKFSIQPLLKALDAKDPAPEEPTTSDLTKKLNEVVVLSDDEEDSTELQVVAIKSELNETAEMAEAFETSDNNTGSVIDETPAPDLIDLTDEPYEEGDEPNEFPFWMANLIDRVKVRKEATMNQRFGEAAISDDVIVIDDPDEISETVIQSNDEAQAEKITPVNMPNTTNTNATHTNSPSIDSGCVLSNREEVGINGNSSFELCSSNQARIDDTQADNQLCQQEQANHGHVNNISIDVNSLECIASNVSSSDGNKAILPMNIASDSISSCSDEAAEQLLTVSHKNHKHSDRLPSDLIDNVQNTKDSISKRSIQTNTNMTTAVATITEQSSDVDSMVGSTSLLEPTIFSDNLPQPSQIPVPLTSYTRPQVVSDKNLPVNNDNRNDESVKNQNEQYIIAPEIVSDPLDEYNPNVSRSQVNVKTITVVHPTRHITQSAAIGGETRSDIPQDMTNASAHDFLECSIPLSSIKSNSLFTKTTDNRSSPQSHDRTIRSATNIINESSSSVDNNSPAIANARRRIADKTELTNENEMVPSTIMERKTYIKKTHTKTTSSGNRNIATRPHQIQHTRSPTISSNEPANRQHLAISHHTTNEQQQHHISPSKTTQTQHQPYKLFYSGTELDLGLNDIGSPLSECASPSTNAMQSLTSAHCESDNNLIHNSNMAMKLNGPTASLPSAIVHPLGLDQHTSKHLTKLNVKPLPEKASLNDTFCGTIASRSNDERSLVEDYTMDYINSYYNFKGGSSNNECKQDPEYFLKIYKNLKDRLETMGVDPENEMNKTRTKRLIEADDMNASNYSPDLNDENDEGDASLPFKKRRKLPVFSDTLIKEEESDSQPSFESPSSNAPSLQCEIELSSTNINTSIGMNMNLKEESTPIPHMERVSYPPTPMLSIANIVEYLPVRAYSTFNSPAPEIAPVRFNILPQQAMVINNASTSNVMGSTNLQLDTSTGSARAPSNQHVEFETTFNLIPSQQPPTNPLSASAQANVVNNNNNLNCGIVASDGEQYLGSISADNATNGFNVTQYHHHHHQAFHPNSPYAATYSIQPAHTHPNSLPPNFDIQNMFNLHNYQMNPQHYHNLLQNSRINFQEKKSILLNDYVTNINDGSQESVTHLNQQQQQQLQHQLHQSHMHQNILQTSIDTKSSSSLVNKPMAPRTKAARKMVTETVTAIGSNEKPSSSATKTNRVTRSSIRTTRAQNVNTEQKSPRRKTNRHR